MITALIPAAGRGVRIGDSGPKALMSLGGRPMILWSVDAIAAVPSVGEVIVAAPSESMTEFEAARRRWTSETDRSPAAWRSTVVGGATRAESVARLLDHARGDRVLVHDAARPCVSAGWIGALIEELGEDPAGVPAVPVRDTLKRGAGGRVTETVPRDGLYAIQTPQIFDLATLRRAHAAAAASAESSDATDDAMLVERLGVPVRLLEGDPMNVKVTYPEDVGFAEEILRRRRASAGRGAV